MYFPMPSAMLTKYVLNISATAVGSITRKTSHFLANIYNFCFVYTWYSKWLYRFQKWLFGVFWTSITSLLEVHSWQLAHFLTFISESSAIVNCFTRESIFTISHHISQVIHFSPFPIHVWYLTVSSQFSFHRSMGINYISQVPVKVLHTVF